MSTSTASQLESHERLSSSQLVVIDFYATWCGPCKMIAPQIEQLSKEYPDVKFVKIDVDQFDDAASKYSVSAMPTFIFLKGGVKVAEVVGASIEKVKQTIESHK